MITSLSDICIYNSKLEGRGFVGLKFENGDLKVLFPLGYRSAETDCERRKDILNLIESRISGKNTINKETYSVTYASISQS